MSREIELNLFIGGPEIYSKGPQTEHADARTPSALGEDLELCRLFNPNRQRNVGGPKKV